MTETKNENRQPLFRIEPHLAGRRRECAAFASSPATNALLLYCICGLVVLACLYASQQTLARKATVPGRVELFGGELKLYADSRRILRKLYVEEGALVKEGQTLALLARPDHNSLGLAQAANSGQSYHALAASLKQELERIKRAKANARLVHQANLTSLSARKETLKATLESHRGERRALNSLASLSEEQFERGRELRTGGHLSLTQLEDLEQRHTQNKLKLAANRRSSLALRDQLQALEHELATLDLGLDDNLSALDEARGRSQRELTRLELSLELKLVAPADGVITGVLSHSGATVESNRPLITMVKNAARFRAKLWASSGAAGDLQTGQAVNLMLDAFPHQKHGALQGTITHINESPLTLQELDAPWESAGTTYSLNVMIDSSQTLYARLRPGMNLTADIKLDNSLLVERLFEPLIKAWRRTLS